MKCRDGCGYECTACEREVTCRDLHPSPAEVDHVCSDCYWEEIPNDAVRAS